MTTVLLVEDNPDDETLTLRAFRKSAPEATLIVARDGPEALGYLLGDGASTGVDLRDLPQLVLLDLKLSGMDGLEVLRRIRSAPRTHLIPVVVLTTSMEQGDLVTSYSLGANSYIRKPVDFTQFLDTVRHLGLYWLTMNVIPRV